MRLRRMAHPMAALLLAGCGSQAATGSWLSMPDASVHAGSFPVATGDTHGPAVGQAALDFFSEWKSVYIDYSGKLQRAQIDMEFVDQEQG